MVAIAIAVRRAHGPPLPPEPLQPLTAQRHGQEQEPLPADQRGAQRLVSRSNPYKQVSTVHSKIGSGGVFESDPVAERL